MIYALQSFFNKNSNKYEHNQVIHNTLALVKEKVKFIEYFLAIQNNDTTGHARSKQISKKQLSAVAFQISGAIRTYAYNTDNTPVYNAVKLPLSVLPCMEDTDLLTYIAIVKNVAIENLSHLQPYGITQKNIDNLNSESKYFLKQMTKPRQAIAQKATATQTIKKTIKQLRQIIKGSLDNAMLSYMISQKDFYSDYKLIRKIVDPATHHRTIYGNITCQQTGEPIRYVSVTITQHESQTNIATTSNKLTTAKGYYQFKSLKPGKYKIIFSFEKHQAITKHIELHPRQSKKLDIILKTKE